MLKAATWTTWLYSCPEAVSIAPNTGCAVCNEGPKKEKSPLSHPCYSPHQTVANDFVSFCWDIWNLKRGWWNNEQDINLFVSRCSLVHACEISQQVHESEVQPEVLIKIQWASSYFEHSQQPCISKRLHTSEGSLWSSPKQHARLGVLAFCHRLLKWGLRLFTYMPLSAATHTHPPMHALVVI